jgi:hypothetical protein
MKPSTEMKDGQLLAIKQDGFASRVALRSMTPDDLPAGMRLCRASKWNQLEDDWRCFLELDGGGCRLAELDSNVIGLPAAALLARVLCVHCRATSLVETEDGIGVTTRPLHSWRA